MSVRLTSSTSPESSGMYRRRSRSGIGIGSWLCMSAAQIQSATTLVRCRFISWRPSAEPTRSAVSGVSIQGQSEPAPERRVSLGGLDLRRLCVLLRCRQSVFRRQRPRSFQPQVGIRVRHPWAQPRWRGSEVRFRAEQRRLHPAHRWRTGLLMAQFAAAWAR